MSGDQGILSNMNKDLTVTVAGQIVVVFFGGGEEWQLGLAKPRESRENPPENF